MVRASRGFRAKTRRKLKKALRAKFKPTSYIHKFKAGEKVILKLSPASPSGMPYPKFKGNVGEVVSQRGLAYIVRIRIGKKPRLIITKPEHLKKLNI